MILVINTICHNEEATLDELFRRMPKKISGVDKIIKMLVDDGSSDDTVKIAERNGAVVIENHSQKKLAYSFQAAIDKALELGADFFVNIDGDLQFRPEEITNVVKPVVDGVADFAAGDRFTDPKTGKNIKPLDMPASKYFGNLVGAMIVSKMSGQKFNDVTCGFRAFNRKALLSININSKLTYTQETFQTLASKKLNIVQVPITVKYYPGRKSRVVTSILGYITGSAFNILKTFRDYSPLSFFGTMGFVSFLISLVLLGFTGVHWVRTGGFSPYKFVGFAGIYFISLAIVIWLFGLLADMFDRLINNQDKILYNLKAIRYKKSKD